MDQSKRCANCGHELGPNSRFCSYCGEAQGDLRPRADTGLLPANRRLHGDRYLIVRKLAQGGQSAVYLAMDTASGQRCAIKEMSESQLTTQEERNKAVNDFMREAHILMRLSHPGLCKVFDTFFEDTRKPFLVMEYVEGHNLEDELIGQGRPLEWQRVIVWGMLLCDVLGYLHNQNPPIIYRDLKPANVMLLPSGSIKLIDFGIARQLYPQRMRDTARLGTDGYAPLEQHGGRSEPRSDLYALGASLYHLLTGRVPETAPLRYARQMLTPIRSLNPAVPEAFDRVIQQALRLDAKERFPNAYAMRQALEWARQASAPNSGSRSSNSGPIHSMPRYTGGPVSSPQSPGRGPISGPRPGYSHISGAPQPGYAPPNTTMPPAPLSSVMQSPGNGAPGGNTDGHLPWVGRMGPDSRNNGQIPPPRLRLWPLRLDIGLLETNQTAVQVLELGNRGGGDLLGMVETNSPCVTVDPSQLDPTTEHLRVQVNTTGLIPGEHRYLIAVRTNGGDQIIPVSFMVRPPGNVPTGSWGQRRP